MKNKSIKEDRTELLLACAVLLEIFFLIFYNVYHLRDALDHDFCMVLRHVMEMGDRHTLFLKNWSYMSQGEMDEASLIALPVYMLTKNIFLGYAIAGILNTLLWAWVIWRLLSVAGFDRKYILFALCLVLTAYDFGMLEYTNMLFFAGGYYVYKVLLPLLMLVVMLSDYSKEHGVRDIVLAVIYFVLTFFVALASGTYSLLLGVIPAVIGFFFCVILNVGKERYKRFAAVLIGTLAVTALGIVIGSRNGIEAYSYSIKSLKAVFEELPKTFMDYLELLRVLTPYEERVSTLRGIIGLMHLLLAGFITLFGLFSVVDIFGIQIYRKARDHGKESVDRTYLDRELVKSACISIALWNFLALSLTLSMPRYHIMGAVPLMLCAAMNFGTLLEKDKTTTAPKWFIAIASLVFIYVTLYTGFYAETSYFHEQDENKKIMAEVLKVMDEEDADTAFTVDSTDMAAKLRVEDKTKVFETYMTDGGYVDNHIFYIAERDRSAFSDRNIIIAKEEEFEACPYYIRESYEKVSEVSDYGIWFSENNPIDGMAGLPIEEMSVDLPTAPGYEASGEINAKGYLDSAEEGIVLKSPDIHMDGNTAYRMVCHFDAKGSQSFLDLYINGELSSYPLPSDEDTIEIGLNGTEGTFCYEIRKEDGESIIIKETEFAAAGNS
ncbi:MAG: hypothetical protein K5770_12520 [Lachnospiraceae bacterium]|nr:hypothetical protein [Lachnospiraceae bacterium]